MKVKIGPFPKKNNRRKIDVQIDKFDTWSLDHTLALIIYPALLQLKATKHGVPSELVDDVGGEDWKEQECFDFYKESHDESWSIAAKRWDEILDKMIWSFEQLASDWDDQFHTGKSDWMSKPCEWDENGKAKMYQMVEGPNHTAEFDVEGYQAHSKRIDNGLRLFGKYYRGLWD